MAMKQMHSTNTNAEKTGQHDEQQWHCVRLQHNSSNQKEEINSSLHADLTKLQHTSNGYKYYTGWYNKNETTLVRPTATIIQDKIKRISLKCSQSLRK